MIQLVSAGCSSLIKMPLYFTLGAPCTFRPPNAQTPSLLRTGTSAHQYHGLTPICSLTSYKPKIVPLISLPTITSALSTPGSGLEMTSLIKDSQRPMIGFTSILPALVRAQMRGDFPRVPAIITGAEGEELWRVGPVKFWAGPVVYFSFRF